VIRRWRGGKLVGSVRTAVDSCGSFCTERGGGVGDKGLGVGAFKKVQSKRNGEKKIMWKRFSLSRWGILMGKHMSWESGNEYGQNVGVPGRGESRKSSVKKGLSW